jgi:hypothetical protein
MLNVIKKRRVNLQECEYKSQMIFLDIIFKWSFHRKIKILWKNDSRSTLFIWLWIEIFWNFFNWRLIRNDFVRNMFNFLLTSIIIFVCLCVENAIKEYLIEILTQIKFEIEFMHNMIDVEMKCVLRSRWIQ